MDSTSKPILGYWNARGKAGPIRLLLTYAGVEFIDKRYQRGPGDDRSEWLKDKYNLGLDFPNLPYLIDGEVKLTQTIAILRYLARKYNLSGSSKTSRLRIDLLEQQVVDIFTAFVDFLSKKDNATDAEMATFIGYLNEQLDGISTFLGASPYTAGTEITYVDFLLYEFLYSLDVFEQAEGVLAASFNLVHFCKRIEALPQLSEYLVQVNGV